MMGKVVVSFGGDQGAKNEHSHSPDSYQGFYKDFVF